MGTFNWPPAGTATWPLTAATVQRQHQPAGTSRGSAIFLTAVRSLCEARASSADRRAVGHGRQRGNRPHPPRDASLRRQRPAVAGPQAAPGDAPRAARPSVAAGGSGAGAVTGRGLAALPWLAGELLGGRLPARRPAGGGAGALAGLHSPGVQSGVIGRPGRTLAADVPGSADTRLRG
jgi:hypothetical protein